MSGAWMTWRTVLSRMRLWIGFMSDLRLLMDVQAALELDGLQAICGSQRNALPHPKISAVRGDGR